MEKWPKLDKHAVIGALDAYIANDDHGEWLSVKVTAGQNGVLWINQSLLYPNREPVLYESQIRGAQHYTMVSSKHIMALQFVSNSHYCLVDLTTNEEEVPQNGYDGVGVCNEINRPNSFYLPSTQFVALVSDQV